MVKTDGRREIIREPNGRRGDFVFGASSDHCRQENHTSRHSNSPWSAFFQRPHAVGNKDEETVIPVSIECFAGKAAQHRQVSPVRVELRLRMCGIQERGQAGTQKPVECIGPRSRRRLIGHL